MLGTTERRLAVVILITATLPLVVAILLANSLFKRAARVWVNPDVSTALDEGVGIYRDYVVAVKSDIKHQAAALAADAELRSAAADGWKERADYALSRIFPEYPLLVSLEVVDEKGAVLARRDRGRVVDEARESRLEIRRSLSEADAAPMSLVAVFALDRRYELGLERATGMRDAHARFEREREGIFLGYLRAFVALLAGTVFITVLLGFTLARGVTVRIRRLADAIQKVTAGDDLSVRVPVTGSDELTELARAFNQMLTEMQHSRDRIEYLQRLSAWQDMAQRLAHEIKNPLTPIQLAVQECHSKYDGADLRYQRLLDTTLEIVQEEVGTLRRLVGDFSNFARMPHSELDQQNLADFVRECGDHLAHLEGTPSDGEGEIEASGIELQWEVVTDPIASLIDKQMLRRVVANLVRNGIQAIREGVTGTFAHPPKGGRVRIRASVGADGPLLTIEDSGPGIAEDARERVFDPYFTTKVDGTGLGLAIVKKIVIEHGGSIDIDRSDDLGGARFTIRLPPPELQSAIQARLRPRTSSRDVSAQGVGP